MITLHIFNITYQQIPQTVLSGNLLAHGGGYLENPGQGHKDKTVQTDKVQPASQIGTGNKVDFFPHMIEENTQHPHNG